MLLNASKETVLIPAGTEVGIAEERAVVEDDFPRTANPSEGDGYGQEPPSGDGNGEDAVVVQEICSRPVRAHEPTVVDGIDSDDGVTTQEAIAGRREKLRTTFDSGGSAGEEMQTVLKSIEAYHDIFSLDKGERGETDLIKMTIDTGTASPQRQPPRRVPFAIRQQVVQQLIEGHAKTRRNMSFSQPLGESHCPRSEEGRRIAILRRLPEVERRDKIGYIPPPTDRRLT